jgi:hypothetical protein
MREMVAHPRVEETLRRMRREFLEMPGLKLTPVQAQRLWSLDRLVCDNLLRALVDARFLRRTGDGAFIRSEGSLAPSR